MLSGVASWFLIRVSTPAKACATGAATHQSDWYLIGAFAVLVFFGPVAVSLLYRRRGAVALVQPVVTSLFLGFFVVGLAALWSWAARGCYS